MRCDKWCPVIKGIMTAVARRIKLLVRRIDFSTSLIGHNNRKTDWWKYEIKLSIYFNKVIAVSDNFVCQQSKLSDVCNISMPLKDFFTEPFQDRIFT